MEPSKTFRPIEDPWLQVFTLVALISGVFMAHDIRSPATIPLPAAPSAEGSRPKSPAGWVVDPRLGPDADCSTIAQAASLASDGDQILLKPGTYKGPLSFSKSVALVGTGGSRDKIWLDGGIAVNGGRVSLRNVTISGGPSSAWAASVTRGRLVLEDSQVKSRTGGVRVFQSEVEIIGSRIDAKRGLSAEGDSRVVLKRAEFSGGAPAVSAAGAGVDLRVESCSFIGSLGPAVQATGFSRVRLIGVRATGGMAPAIMAVSGAEVDVTDSTLSDNRQCAISIGGGMVKLTRVLLERNRCGVSFTDAGTLEAWDSRFLDHDIGPLAVKPGIERLITLRGAGNKGLDIPGRSR